MSQRTSPRRRSAAANGGNPGSASGTPSRSSSASSGSRYVAAAPVPLTAAQPARAPQTEPFHAWRSADPAAWCRLHGAISRPTPRGTRQQPPMVQQHARMASSRACGQLQAAVRYDHRACTLTSCSMVLVVQGAAMPWLWCVRRFLWLVGWWHAIELRRGRELRRRRELRRGLAVSRSACRTTWAGRPSRRAQRLPRASSVSDGAVPSTGRR